jgi:hypothetical protein
VEYGRIFDYVMLNYMKNWPLFSEEEQNIFIKTIKIIVKKWFFLVWKDWILSFDLIAKLVEKDIIFYDSISRKITANSESCRQAFIRMV